MHGSVGLLEGIVCWNRTVERREESHLVASDIRTFESDNGSGEGLDRFMSLPPTLFIHGATNEDATVELLVLEAIGAKAARPLRVLSIAGCGTHVVTMCSSPHVDFIDAVDVAPPQLQLGALIGAAVEALSSAEELARFIGNSGEASERTHLYARVRESLAPEIAKFWDDNAATIEAGILQCGGTERLFASVRGHLPTPSLEELAKRPDAVVMAFRAGLTVQSMEDHIGQLPRAAAETLVEGLVPVVAAQLSARLAECAAGEPDFMVELMVHGSFAMTPISSRPQFLRPGVFAAAKQNGCGVGRVAWHEGPLQVVGPKLAAATGPYDLVDMSNILPLDSPDDDRVIIEAIANAVDPGGTLLCRGGQSPGTLARAFIECGLDVDKDLTARALQAESSFLHTDVCVATAR